MNEHHFTHRQIIALLKELSYELEKEGVKGEILVFGGSAMVIAFKSRISTKDIDAVFEPKQQIYKAARRIAMVHELPEEWLTDSVKGFISSSGKHEIFMDMPALKIYIPVPEYLFAMKAMAMRISMDSQDIVDIEFLKKKIGIRSYKQAMAIIQKYYPMTRIPQRTFYALEEIFARKKKRKTSA